MYAVAVTTLVLGLIVCGGAYFTVRRKNPTLTQGQRRALVLGLVGAILLGFGIVLALLTYFDQT